MGSKFKVGDRVRYAKEDGPWSEWQIHKGAEGVVKNVIRDLVDVQFDSTDCIYADELELVESADPKTAFLSDLAAVLRKHNAVINVGWNNYFDTDKSPRIDIDIMFKDGNEGICFEDVLDKSLTAENIMNLNKK